MTVHTPGPWHITTPSMGFSAIRGANGELIFGLAAGSINEKQSDDVCEANARLIAAAPELYEALAAMFLHCEQQLAGWPVDCRNRTIAVLAKVRGETVF